MFLKILLLLVLIFISVYFLLFAQKGSQTIKDFDPEYSYSLVQGGALLLDVRSEQEFEQGHIDGALHIPHTQIAEQKDLLHKLTQGSKEQEIVVYCRSGGRAQVAKEQLLKMGYKNVINHGGIATWKKGH